MLGPPISLLRSVERVDPAEPGEAGEVGIARVQLPAVLDGEGGQVGIIHEVARRPDPSEKVPHDRRVPIARMHDDDAWSREPAADHVERSLHRQRTREDVRMRAQTQEREQHTQASAMVSSPDSWPSSQDRAAAWRGDRVCIA